MVENDGRLLLGITAPIIRGADGQYLVDSQTISGLRAWRENFAHVTAFTICRDGSAPDGYDVLDLAGLQAEGIEIVMLPDTYNRRVYFRQRAAVAAQLLALMRRSDYRTFGYGGWIGDPGEIAAKTARRHGISHAVWFDRVESQVIRGSAGTSPKDRLKAEVMARVTTCNERRAVRTADLSLLHGKTVYDHFCKIARNPHKVEDIHVTKSDRVDAAFVAEKTKAAGDGKLQILYVGRAAPMKGPMDWMAVLAGLKRRGVDFTARWVGGGEMLGQMREYAARNGLVTEGPEDSRDLVLEGFIDDRVRVMQFYRQAHLQLFCHLTDESPRNLIESLHSATPLVGYGDPFATGLVDERGAGVLVPRGDTGRLVDELAALNADRARLSDLILRASQSAEHLTRDEVFRHRSEVIRSQMPPRRSMI